MCVHKINIVACIVSQLSMGVFGSATLQKHTQNNSLFSHATVMTDSQYQCYFVRLLTEIAPAAIYTFYFVKILAMLKPSKSVTLRMQTILLTSRGL